MKRKESFLSDDVTDRSSAKQKQNVRGTFECGNSKAIRSLEAFSGMDQNVAISGIVLTFLHTFLSRKKVWRRAALGTNGTKTVFVKYYR